MLMLLLLLAQAGQQGVQFVPAKDVTAAMEKTTPTPMIDTEHYSVMGLRRTAAGQVEVHEKDTDVFYVIDGKATFVTGGKVIGGKTTAPGETRGTGIEGGQTQLLSKGDVITIRNGTPHWFKAVEGSVTYFVVKVR
jgi:quercetin dioxygenase-like cupin family protein